MHHRSASQLELFPGGLRFTQELRFEDLPLANTELQRDLWHRLQPVSRVAATDTYKRTMAGLETFLYPWFGSPVTAKEVRQAHEHFTRKGEVTKFPDRAWQSVLANDGYFPLDIWALRGGQTFLAKDGKHVPFMSIEGPGALANHLEPAIEQMHKSLIHATKARLFCEAAGEKFAEFGLRSDGTMNTHVPLMLALFVGGGYYYTSDDQCSLIFPEYFTGIGTVGHEFIMSFQREGVSLEQAQETAFRTFVAANDKSALLPDTMDTVKSGLPMILKLMLEYQGSGKVIMPRFDSGDVTAFCVLWKKMTLAAGISKISIVVEDGYTPGKARKTKEAYAAAGFDPNDIIVGAGGYFQDGCTRDAISLAYKRSATLWEGILEYSIKFSDSPGKESIPGQIRIYGKDRTIIVAQAGEEIDGELLMEKVVDQGHIVYREELPTQRDRAARTWDAYDTIEYSPETQRMMDKRRAEKAALLVSFAPSFFFR